MVRLDDWEVFSARARRLVASTLDDVASTSTSSIKKRKRPRVARCVVKYQHSRGKLAVRVTDDVTCLQFATDQLSDVKRVERLATWLVAVQATGSAERATAEVAAVAVAVAGGGTEAGSAGAVTTAKASASAACAGAAAPLKAKAAAGSKGGSKGGKGRARG